jgi:dCTP deaminase
MIIPDHEIARLCTQSLMVVPYNPELQNPASLDVLLGDTLMVEVDDTPELQPLDISECSEDKPFLLYPGWFCLAQTQEVFNLPDHIAAQFVLKSSRAREGLEHLLAGYCDPGWNGSVLTLELQNARRKHPVKLWPGMKIGQMVFHAIAGKPECTYAQTGRYNGDLKVTASRG